MSMSMSKIYHDRVCPCGLNQPNVEMRAMMGCCGVKEERCRSTTTSISALVREEKTHETITDLLSSGTAAENLAEWAAANHTRVVVIHDGLYGRSQSEQLLVFGRAAEAENTIVVSVALGYIIFIGCRLLIAQRSKRGSC